MPLRDNAEMKKFFSVETERERERERERGRERMNGDSVVNFKILSLIVIINFELINL